MSLWELAMAWLMIAIPMLISWNQQLDLMKDLLWSAARGFLQLMAVGYVLRTVFALQRWPYIGLMLAVMIVIAAKSAARRGRGLPGAFGIVLPSIVLSEIVVLALWLLLRIASPKAEMIIPMSGMIIGNSMVAAGLALERLTSEMKSSRDLITAALALGAPARIAAGPVIRKTVRAALIPNIDSMRTIGLVQLPGMMTGLILGGTSPLQAVRFQIVITFSIAAGVSLATIAVALLAYRRFFTVAHQLVIR